MPIVDTAESQRIEEETIVESVDRRTQWRGQPDTRRWRFLGMVGLSLVLHSPLTPFAALLGLLGFLGLSDPVEAQDLPPITAIPVDILYDEPTEAEPEPVASEPAEPTPAPPEPEPEVAALEPAPAPEAPDAGVEEAQDAGADASEPAEPEMGDPVALSGSAGKIADENANVRIKIDTEKVREHPLGAKIGQVLARVPQWHDFLGPAKLDPIQDIDRLLIAGPQLRDSSEVIAVLKYNVEQSAMEAAIDGLVQRSSGRWLPGPTKAASARADRAERIFSFIAPGLLAIVPPSAERDALRPRPKGLTFPPIPGDAVLTAFIQTPHKVYTGLPFRFPESFQWVKASVMPAEDGGAIASIEAQDESESEAAANADWLERSVVAVTSPRGLAAAAAQFLYGGDKFIQEVSFRAEGAKIRGTLRLTASQLHIILSMVEGIVNSWAPKTPKPAASPSASAPVPVPTPSASVPAPLPGAPAPRPPTTPPLAPSPSDAGAPSPAVPPPTPAPPGQ